MRSLLPTTTLLQTPNGVTATNMDCMSSPIFNSIFIDLLSPAASVVEPDFFRMPPPPPGPDPVLDSSSSVGDISVAAVSVESSLLLLAEFLLPPFVASIDVFLFFTLMPFLVTELADEFVFGGDEEMTSSSTGNESKRA